MSGRFFADRQPQMGGFYEVFPAIVGPLSKAKKGFQEERSFEGKNTHQNCGRQ